MQSLGNAVDWQVSKKYLLVSLFIVSLLYVNTIYWMVGSWIVNPYYSHGFFVLAASLYFGYRNYKKYLRSRQLKVVRTYENLGLIILCLAILIHTLATVNQYLWISAVTYPFAIFGVLMVFYRDAAKKLAFPVFFMLLAVPYPIYGIANTLEIFSAKSSVFIMKFIGIKTSLVGAEIITSGGKFIVGAPCSGIRSILAMLTVMTLYIYIINECFEVKIILLALSIPLAMLANILRIVCVVVAANYFGFEFAMRFVHTFSDLVLFVLAVVFLIFLRSVINRLCKTNRQI